MKIRSITDVITNSSSEVFIIKRNKKYNQPFDPMSLVEKVCKVLRLDINSLMTWEIAKKDGEAVKGWKETKCKKGDLIVRSVGDNSIPYVIMALMEDLSQFDKSAGDINRVHLG